jgi:hypothetical protein
MRRYLRLHEYISASDRLFLFMLLTSFHA